MSGMSRIWRSWWAGFRGEPVEIIPTSRCARGRVRHRFLGERYCQRCRAENPRWHPVDLLAEAREIAAKAEQAE